MENHTTERNGIERTCIVHAQPKPKDALIRFVRAPDGYLTPDITCRLPGRGVWISAHYEDVCRALDNKKSLRRALKRDLKFYDDLPDRVADLLKRHALGYLALAHAAGVLHIGFEKIRRALNKKHNYIILHAGDGSVRERQKLNAERYQKKVKIITCLLMHEISTALGRENVIHVAMEITPITEKFVNAVQKYQEYAISQRAEQKYDALT